MNEDIGLSAAAFGFGAGVFFIGYFLFEVPSNLILHRVGARVWIARIMFTWGIISGAMAFVQGTDESLCPALPARRRRGAGFFPGIILYLSYWFPARHRAGVTALFMAAVPISIAIGSPISGALLTLDGILGLHGWQWMFLVEAAPAVLLTGVVLTWLTDRPEHAKWPDDEERDWLVAEMKAEEADVTQEHGSRSALRALANPWVLALALVYFGTSAGLYTVGIWSPQIIAQTRCGAVCNRHHQCGTAHSCGSGHGPLVAALRSNRRTQLARGHRVPFRGRRADARGLQLQSDGGRCRADSCQRRRQLLKAAVMEYPHAVSYRRRCRDRDCRDQLDRESRRLCRTFH